VAPAGRLWPSQRFPSGAAWRGRSGPRWGRRVDPVPDMSATGTSGGMASRASGRGRVVPSGVIETKLIPPPLRRGTVGRGELLDRLTGAETSSVVGVFAPAGCGKTTLLAQLLARERRPVAWVSIDEGDDDPVVLLSHLAVAVDRALPLPPELFFVLASPGPFEPQRHLPCVFGAEHATQPCARSGRRSLGLRNEPRRDRSARPPRRARLAGSAVGTELQRTTHRAAAGRRAVAGNRCGRSCP
jgi:hypothetical protein